MVAPIHRVVLTGGPCAGKTTCLDHLSQRLEALGFRVFLVPEVASILLGGGASLADVSVDEFLHFEGRLVTLQMQLEDTFHELAAATARPAVVVCDRGTMDPAAYLTESHWRALLDEHGWTEVALRDRRYDAVVHLVTAADGAERFYTTENNPNRAETPAQARALDRKLQAAWVGHPHLRVVDNSDDFQHKVQRVVDAVCRVVEAPAPREIERKYLLASAPNELPVHSRAFEIEQTYLVALHEGEEVRVRRRTSQGNSVYTHTTKRPLEAGQRVEIERQVNGREYLTLLEQRDPSRRPLHKQRRCFLWEKQYFELDLFRAPREGLALLEVELDHLDQSVTLPPFLEVVREVTNEPEFSNNDLARLDAATGA